MHCALIIINYSYLIYDEIDYSFSAAPNYA